MTMAESIWPVRSAQHLFAVLTLQASVRRSASIPRVTSVAPLRPHPGLRPLRPFRACCGLCPRIWANVVDVCALFAPNNMRFNYAPPTGAMDKSVNLKRRGKPLRYNMCPLQGQHCGCMRPRIWANVADVCALFAPEHGRTLRMYVRCLCDVCPCRGHII